MVKKKLTRLQRAFAKSMNARDVESARSLWYVLPKVMTMGISTSDIVGKKQSIIILTDNNDEYSTQNNHENNNNNYNNDTIINKYTMR